MKPQAQRIYDSTLALVVRYGWTTYAFRQGAHKAGIRLADAEKAFPQGIEDIVAAFRLHINEGMQTKIKAKRGFSSMRVRDKITFALRARFEVMEVHREEIRRLLVWSLLPQNLRASTQELWKVADTIWVAAGDISTDYNHYTKRLLLIAVMKSVLCFWLNDSSANQKDSWEFLDRRIEDIMKVGKTISVIKTVGVSDIVSFIKSRLVA